MNSQIKITEPVLLHFPSFHPGFPVIWDIFYHLYRITKIIAENITELTIPLFKSLKLTNYG